MTHVDFTEFLNLPNSSVLSEKKETKMIEISDDVTYFSHFCLHRSVSYTVIDVFLFFLIKFSSS